MVFYLLCLGDKVWIDSCNAYIRNPSRHIPMKCHYISCRRPLKRQESYHYCVSLPLSLPLPNSGSADDFKNGTVGI